jgi:hypothetical protein
MSLFTIKKKHAVACRPRVCTSHFNKCAIRDVATLSGIPNHDRGRHNDYAQTLYQPPQESFLLLFFKKEEKNYNSN